MDHNILPILLRRRVEPSDVVLGESGLYTFINPYSYLIHREDPGVLTAFRGIFYDALTMVWAMNTGLHAGVHRHSFDLGSLAGPVLVEAERRGLSVFFAGTTDAHLGAAVANLQEAYPGLRVAGTRHGFFAAEEEFRDAARTIADLAPDVLIVGMGAPLQERFLTSVQAEGWQGTGFTCGGFLEQTARSVRYYHPLVNRLSLRWLVRMMRHRHVVERVVRDYPRALVRFIEDAESERGRRDDSMPRATAPTRTKTGL